jgi:hypothetical protein
MSKTAWILSCCAVVFSNHLLFSGDIEVFVVNPLEKVFRDSKLVKGQGEVIELAGASNEFESAQFVIRAAEKFQIDSVEFTALVNAESGSSIPAASLQWRFVGFVPVERNTSDAQCGAHQDIPKGELLRLAPFDCPDPLLEDRSISVEAGHIQPIWITVKVPKGTSSGIFRGQTKVQTSLGDYNLPIELTVFPFELPDERHLYLTNWFQSSHITRAHQVELFSEDYWTILARYARDFAEHHHNVIYTPWRFIKVFREPDGELSFDYTNFDRFVQTFLDAGTADRIEIQHIAHHGEKGRSGREILVYRKDAIDRKTGEVVSLPGNQGMEALLRNLRQHLREKGWLERTIIHVADEPSFHNMAQWKEISRFVHELIPEAKTIDAISSTGYEDSLDIMVPLTQNVATWFDDFKRAQADGTELWFYTCCSPWGYYANRFLDYHLSKTRILHWMNYFTGPEGFLHWGLTYGWEDPFGPAPRFPPGDSHIIYPGKEGPMSSIRWEMLREGMEDYEYFWMLENRSRELMQKMGIAQDRYPADFRSREICGQLVSSLTDYVTDPETFYSVRQQLAAEISEIDQKPYILMATDPSSNTHLETGPATAKVYGFVEVGTRVTINGSEAEVNPQDGSFLQKVRFSWSQPVLTVEAERDGKRKILQREFEIR